MTYKDRLTNLTKENAGDESSRWTLYPSGIISSKGREFYQVIFLLLLSYGMLPAIYTSSNATIGLSAYIDVYLREEIKAEALVRNLDSFLRFLDIAALTDGEIVNYNNIATDCWVSAHTVKEYFQILEDTLLGYTIPAYTKTIKRRLIQSPKFYLGLVV